MIISNDMALLSKVPVFRKWLAWMAAVISTVLFLYFTLQQDMDLRIWMSNEKNNKELFTKADSKAAWILKRNILLKNSTHKKLLLFCYMCGGSTFFSQLFQQNEDVMFWYEPLDAFYSASYGVQTWHIPSRTFWLMTKDYSFRNSPLWERESMANFSHNLLSCKHQSLPTDLLLHQGLYKAGLLAYRDCIISHRFNYDMLPECRKNVESICELRGKFLNSDCHEMLQNALNCLEYNETGENRTLNQDECGNIGQRGNISLVQQKKNLLFKNYARCLSTTRQKYSSPCLPALKNECDKAKLVAYKGLRLTMKHVERMLQQDPDLHILYLIRDPRGTASSAVGSRLTLGTDGTNTSLESQYLCKKMLYDYLLYLDLRNKYTGAIKLVRYEDLCKDRFRVLEDVYQFLGMTVHPSVCRWLKDDAKKVNSTASIEKWRKKNSLSVQKVMTEQCSEILRLLNYTF